MTRRTECGKLSHLLPATADHCIIGAVKHQDNTDPEKTTQRNYYRLFMLRNAEIAAIGLGITIATTFFKLSLPLQPLLVILALITGLNIFTWLRLTSGVRYSDAELFVQMLLDVAGLTGVFFYTGGASNPFVWFFLLPLMIAATILPRRYTWIMATVTVLCYSALFFIDVQPDAGHAHHESGFQMHVFGMWLGFVMSAGFVAVIIVGMAHNLRERDRKLAEAREQALQNERLVALGTLATGAAHELGTPLGTMAILTADLEQEYADSADRDLHRKLGILRGQIDRCKETLSVISASAGAGRAESGHRMAVKDYLDEVIAEWQGQRPDAIINMTIDSLSAAADILAERTLSQALINILNNAADASPDNISFHARWTSELLNLEVSDRGPGLNADIHEQLGKTPVTTKDEGLGVGLYLAQATIQRLGGKLSINNRKAGGTTLHITLPLLTESVIEGCAEERSASIAT
jgi:two-component system sensor histidine kinase RegB